MYVYATASSVTKFKLCLTLSLLVFWHFHVCNVSQSLCTFKLHYSTCGNQVNVRDSVTDRQADGVEEVWQADHSPAAVTTEERDCVTTTEDLLNSTDTSLQNFIITCMSLGLISYSMNFGLSGEHMTPDPMIVPVSCLQSPVTAYLYQPKSAQIRDMSSERLRPTVSRARHSASGTTIE